MLTYKFRLYPNKEQKEKILQTINTCRILYNNSLGDRIALYKNYDYKLGYTEQANMLKHQKKINNHINNVHSQILQNCLKRLDTSYQNFFRRVKKGLGKVGYPRFKGQGQYDSFTYPQSGYSIKDSYIKLSGIGNVKIKLHREIKGNIKTCTIKHKNNKFYVCFASDYKPEPQEFTGKQVGIDVGIKNFYTTSDGQFFENPKIYKKSLNKLKKTQKRLSRQKKGSNRRLKTKLILGKQHEKIANQRKDISHKASRQLVNNYDLIVHEDLNIKDMVKNHYLAQNINDVAWGMFFQFLQYKAENAGKVVMAVNPYNTSQVCSDCGCVVKKDLSVRIHNCAECGLVLDRDINAAINILKLSGCESATVEDEVTSPLKREAYDFSRK